MHAKHGPNRYSFNTTIECPTTNEPIEVEVFYWRADEKTVPVIRSVAHEGPWDEPRELVYDLDSETVVRLKQEADAPRGI